MIEDDEDEDFPHEVFGNLHEFQFFFQVEIVILFIDGHIRT